MRKASVEVVFSAAGWLPYDPYMTFRQVRASLVLRLVLLLALVVGTTSAAFAAPVSAATVAGPVAAASSPGWLHTAGGKIVTASGAPYTIRGIAWFGMETSSCAPHGLDTITLAGGMQHIKQMGFTTVRLPFSNQCLAASGVTGVSADPSLAGLTPLQVMDHVVASAKSAGLDVILDQHRPDSGGQSELWYTSQYPESRWISDWRMLAKRYASDPAVIGVDLHNEPHGAATWGTGAATTDWRAAAERGGNAVLAENPNLLVLVEGIDHEADGSGTWWGGALGLVGNAPVRLSVANRVVYSPHDYPSTIYGQSWFSASNYPANLPGIWDAHWGYLAKKDIAPVLVGEFGTKFETTSDKQWLNTLVGYLSSTGISSSFWAFNPNSGDTGGIVKSDWVTPEQAKLDALAPILHPSPGSGPGSGGSGSQPAPQPDPANPGAVSAKWQPGSSWASGYVANIDVTATAAVTGWTVSWASPGTTRVVNSWGMRCSVASGTVSCTGTDWASKLAAGQTVHVGLQASGGPAPSSPRLTATAARCRLPSPHRPLGPRRMAVPRTTRSARATRSRTATAPCRLSLQTECTLRSAAPSTAVPPRAAPSSTSLAQGTVRVQVADQCHECEVGHLDLSEEAFRALGDFNAGIIPISYVTVRDPAGPTVAIRVKEGSTRWWAGLQVLNAGNRIDRVEIQAGRQWLPLTRTDYGYWVTPSPIQDGPLTVKVTDQYGRAVVLPGLRMAPGEIQRTPSRYYPVH